MNTKNRTTFTSKLLIFRNIETSCDKILKFTKTKYFCHIQKLYLKYEF